MDASVGKYDWGRASPALSPPVDPTGNGRGPSIDNTKKTNQGKEENFHFKGTHFCSVLDWDSGFRKKDSKRFSALQIVGI